MGAQQVRITGGPTNLACILYRALRVGASPGSEATGGRIG